MGPTCAIHARSNLSESRLQEINDCLEGLADSIERTKKGRVWFLRKRGRPVEVNVESTDDVPSDCEHELLDLGLLPEDTSFRIVLAAGLNREEDYSFLSEMAAQLAEVVNGVATEPTK